MKNKIILLMGIFFVIMFVAYASQDVTSQEVEVNITRTSGTMTICNEDGKCTLTIYSTPVNMENLEGEYLPFTQVVNFSWEGTLDAFNLSWNDKYLILRPEVMASNGNNYTISDLRELFPAVNFSRYLTFDSFHYKWGLNFTNIPENLMDKIDYIKLQAIDWSGITLNDIELDTQNHRLIFFNKVELSYQDLIDSNFTLNHPNKLEVWIGNVTNQSSLFLDPSIQLTTADTENLDDTYAFEGDTSTNGASSSLVVGTESGGEYYVSYIKWNISSIDWATNETDESLLCLYHYNDIDSHSGETYEVWNVSSASWNETGCFDYPGAVCPNVSIQINTSSPSGADDGTYWECFNVTTAFDGVVSGAVNISFFINRTASTAADYCAFYSKEHGTASLRPYLNITYSARDLTLPTITIQSPTNTTHTSQTIDLNVTADEAISEWRYSLNGSTNVTFTPNTSITYADGYTNLTVWANDTSDNWNETIVYFTVDSVAPSINVLSPTSYQNLSVTSVDLNVTGSDATTSIEAWWYELDQNGTNVTFTPNVTLSGLSQLNHNITVYVNDTAGNINSSTVFFNVDQTAPTYSSVNPENLSVVFSDLSEVHTFNANWEDSLTTVEEVRFEFNSVNYTANLSTGTTYEAKLNNIAAGSYNFRWYANDTLNNVNFTDEYTFTVSTGGAPGGGGGGGGGGSYCPNGWCEFDETEESCPEDCVIALPNFTFQVLPTSGVISRFFSPNATWQEEVSVLNPNADNISVSVYIGCDDNDPSCEWLWLVAENGTEEKSLNLIVQGGTDLSPGRKRINVVMTTPGGIEPEHYRSLITFKAIGQQKVVTFELVGTTGFGIFGVLFSIFQYELFNLDGFSVQLWMIGGIIILLTILGLLLAMPRYRKTIRH